ncbi:MFS general substrate transporter [Rhizodiscina lignyota]|uniref:MFS general substrate transporter n=1 Tax=Rhizodiscina lignyota TaxID=1504668 RepID=A0A9P4IKQ8_9PEZI|nr:MFS general substrate transporter [Rhizodiscina lignyota]
MATTALERKLSSPTLAELQDEGEGKGNPYGDLKLDQHGLPLVPQPSSHADDPLNWPNWYKYYVLFLLCLLAFVVQFGAGFVPAAFGPIAKSFGVTHQQASYLTTCYTLLGGVTPLLITPYVNLWGRRPAYILFTLIAIAANIGSGYAKTYATEIVSRVFVGVGASVALAIGGATICDMFFQGERGRYMGFYALALTNGPHFGPIAGGFVALNLGWRWIFFINAIMLSAVLVLFIVSFPETLFSREEFSNLESRGYWSRMAFRGRVLNRKLTWRDFIGNFRMLKYVAIVVPCAYYMTANTYGSIIFVLTASSITEDLYKFNTAQNGLLLGIPLTIGCLIGESCTGWISDALINRYARRHGGYRKPETRLWLAPIGLLLPAGLIIHGVSVQNRAPWIALAIGMAVTSIGTQAATTLTYAYCTDCYKPQAAEVSTLINLFRQMFAFVIGFYALPFGEGDGYGVAWGTFAAINFLFWIPLMWLIWRGKWIRDIQGEPDLHNDL